MKKYIFYFCLLSIFAFVFFHSQAWAANPLPRSEEEKRIEEEKRVSLEKTEAIPLIKEKTWNLETGGWFTSLYVYNHDDDNNSETVDLVPNAWYQDFRLWAKLVYKQKASLYLRLKDTYVQREASDSYTGVGSDNSGPSLDLGYINLSLEDIINRTSNLIIGRQYLSLGRAISYNDINDGIQFTANFSNWNLKAFACQTRPYQDNLDYSVPGYDKNGERSFYAAQLDYLGIKDHILYTYFLIQRDRADEDPEDTAQEFDYNSEYYGLGATGKIFDKRIEYWAELIKETGEGYTDSSASTLTQADINAWGFDAGVKYRFDCWMHPAFDFEYAFGGGDPDRSKVDVTKSGGNTSGDDTNFLYFGGLYAGYALAPRLSNIHIYKLGTYFIPFEETKIGGNIICGLKYYYYVKARSQGGISDLEATESDKDIGQEIDMYAYWKATANTYLSVRGGLFFPGDAYPPADDDCEKYILLSVTTSF